MRLGVFPCAVPWVCHLTPSLGFRGRGEMDGEVRKEDENPSRLEGPLSRCGPGLIPSRTRGSRRAPLLRAGGLARRDVCGVSELVDLRELRERLHPAGMMTSGCLLRPERHEHSQESPLSYRGPTAGMRRRSGLQGPKV